MAFLKILSILDGYTKHLKNVRDYLRDGLMTRFQLGNNKRKMRRNQIYVYFSFEHFYKIMFSIQVLNEEDPKLERGEVIFCVTSIYYPLFSNDI